MQKLTKEQVKQELRNEFQEVKFQKTDGTERTLVGTLSPEIIEGITETPYENNKQTTENPDIVKIFCPDEPGNWRSFRLDSLIEIKTHVAKS